MYIDCPKGVYHTAVKEVPKPVTELANRVLSKRIHENVTFESCFVASHGPLLESFPKKGKEYKFKSESVYRLVYMVRGSLFCVHVNEDPLEVIDLHSNERSTCHIL